MNAAFRLIVRFAAQETYALKMDELMEWYGGVVRWRDTVCLVASTPGEASRALRRATALWVEYALDKIEAAAGRKSFLTRAVRALAGYYREQNRFMHRNALVRLCLDLNDWCRGETGADLNVEALSRCLTKMLTRPVRPLRISKIASYVKKDFQTARSRRRVTTEPPDTGNANRQAA
jgi:hypothetical protein